MTLRLESPHLRATCKDGSAWVLPADARERLRDAWMKGRAFWTGVDLWGATVDIKLGDVTGIQLRTADVIALHAEETEVERVRAMVDGSEE